MLLFLFSTYICTCNHQACFVFCEQVIEEFLEGFGNYIEDLQR